MKTIQKTQILCKEYDYIKSLLVFAEAEDNSIFELTSLKISLKNLQLIAKSSSDENSGFSAFLKDISNFLSIHSSLLESLESKMTKWKKTVTDVHFIGSIFNTKVKKTKKNNKTKQTNNLFF